MLLVLGRNLHAKSCRISSTHISVMQISIFSGIFSLYFSPEAVQKKILTQVIVRQFFPPFQSGCMLSHFQTQHAPIHFYCILGLFQLKGEWHYIGAALSVSALNFLMSANISKYNRILILHWKSNPLLGINKQEANILSMLFFLGANNVLTY